MLAKTTLFAKMKINVKLEASFAWSDVIEGCRRTAEFGAYRGARAPRLPSLRWCRELRLGQPDPSQPPALIDAYTVLAKTILDITSFFTGPA